VPQREERHPWRRLRWLPEVLVLLLVAAAFATQGLNLSDKLFGGGATTPAAVPPPEGLDLVAGATAPPVAATDTGGRIDAAAVRRALDGIASDAGLGPHAAVWVSDLGTGSVVFRHGPAAVVPASTMKLLTTTAALQVLGPMSRFHTSVRLGPAHALTLVGGGDPFLMSTRAKARGVYPARADLETLAARTAQSLVAQGIHQVRLGYDTSLFTGPAVSPAWPGSYLTEDVVPPITALWADEGRGPNGRYVADPAARAANLFAQALSRRGIVVGGPVVATKAPDASRELTTIASAPLGEIAEKTLAVSDNNAAEVIGHQVGLVVAKEGSFAAGAEAVTQVLRRLGVPLAGSQIHDGSGLSREDRLTPAALLAVLRLASAEDHPRLRQVITGLPVAGFTGSLQWRFEKGPAEAKGRVRAKTGTLTGVSGLAGIAVDADGNRMAFVAIADRVAVPDTLAARADLDRIAAALGACHCGSSP
jgi:D-alanyl-D-alanine carboxypeptidase/D-alanyl-D-alanine-endopeptidase (penicillin-binding protein 4)